VDELLENNGSTLRRALEKKIENKKDTVKLKESKSKRKLQKLKSHNELASDDEIPWFKERDCLLLLLETRILLKEMIQLKLKQERMALGELTVDEIQNLLKSQKEEQETDWITGFRSMDLLISFRNSRTQEKFGERSSS
jgi:hypothetical protein